MKLNFVIIFVSLVLCSAHSQDMSYQKPDYDMIHDLIQDSTTTFFYPDLMSRLEAYDTTLSVSDYIFLYYGYLFQEDYKPNWSSPDDEKLLHFYKKNNVKESDYDRIIELATQCIKKFPFDLSPMNYLGYIYHLKGDDDMARKVSNRFNMTLEAIVSTGDGLSFETGFHVISTSHEYVILDAFQFEFLSQEQTGDCDFLEVEKDDRGLDGVYFNIKQLLKHNMDTIETE